VVAKTKRHFKKIEDWELFYEAWNAVINSITKEGYEEQLKQLRTHKAVAVEYVEKTWLVWREKIVS